MREVDKSNRPSEKWGYVCKKWAIISGKKWEIGFCRREVGTSSRREMGSRTIRPCKWKWAVIADTGKRNRILYVRSG